MRNLGHVYTADHNAFNCTPRMVLNISRESMARYGFSPATRVFEAAGAGACLITDYWEGIDFFFEPEKEILSARNGSEVAAHVQNTDPNARAKDRRRGLQARARATHLRASRRGIRSDPGRQRTRNEDRHSRALDHLFVGQRPRHDLSRTGAGVGRVAVTKLFFSSAISLGTPRTAICPNRRSARRIYIRASLS